ncbi:MAG: nickel pincer cofactor biosynthesis protein LarB [Clostridiales Family XIII bacterium]|jgi:NCAIR mutase (PurE)-related protein|nr:nickel pincer cofactor biosynthesis protein LarB [Clostridiales Family XIII bacterium]
MRSRKIDQYLKDVAEGRVSPAEAAEKLRMQPYDDMDFAKLDTNRELRTGRGEVVFALGKTPEQVASIMRRMSENETGNISPILATKAGQEHFEAVQSAFDDGFLTDNLLTLEYNETAKMIIIKSDKSVEQGRDRQGDESAEQGRDREGAARAGGNPGGRGLIAVVSGGTADVPIAEEAAITAELYGHDVKRVYDVGISGLHRLLDKIEDIRKADVVIAVAGMEGALASVIAGLVSSPVVAVPTSVGYGITLSGLTPLFAMLGGCSLGVGVMNIDNGFGAAHYASMMLGMKDRGQ